VPQETRATIKGERHYTTKPVKDGTSHAYAVNTTSPRWISTKRLETFAHKQRRQSIGTPPQCMANRWRFHRPIRSSVSGVTNLGWFLRGGVPSPSAIARQRPLVTSANNNYDGSMLLGAAYAQDAIRFSEKN